MTDLLMGNAGSQIDLDRAMDRVKLLWSDIEGIQAERAAKIIEIKREVDVAGGMGVAKWNLEQQTLVAPIDGVVLDRPLATRTGGVAINDAVMKIADVTPANS